MKACALINHPLSTHITFRCIIIAFMFVLPLHGISQQSIPYPIVDTDQETFYDTIQAIEQPLPGDEYYGQDAQFTIFPPQYQDNGDGTISDLITGLMWLKSPDINQDGQIDIDDKLSFEDAASWAETYELAGYSDWRLPSVKELYSLIVFSGRDPSGYNGTSTEDLIPFIDTDYFEFAYGDVNAGERIIDAQMATSTLYVGTTMMGDETMFGVNFADGRIKGYGTGPLPGQTEPKQFYVYFVRGNSNYGINDFEDNGDGTITDHATGLMWSKDDSKLAMNWPDALAYAEDSELAGYNDWRLPNAKEMQSLVDYTRAPAITNSAAIDPIFNTPSMIDEGGNENYPFYWTGTTHASYQEDAPGGYAAYVCFGEALGWMEAPPMSGNYTLMDVHGAGAQRSDPKVGNPANWPFGHGPQGDVIRINNYVRMVRNVDSTLSYGENPYINTNVEIYPNPSNDLINIVTGIINSGILSVYSASGSIVHKMEFEDKTKLQFSLHAYTPGVYLLNISNHQYSASRRFIVN